MTSSGRPTYHSARRAGRPVASASQRSTCRFQWRTPYGPSRCAHSRRCRSSAATAPRRVARPRRASRTSSAARDQRRSAAAARARSVSTNSTSLGAGAQHVEHVVGVAAAQRLGERADLLAEAVRRVAARATGASGAPATARRPGRRAPRRPRPTRAGRGRRPAPAGRRGGPPRAAGPSSSATPSTSRRRRPRRTAAGCRGRAGTGCACRARQPSSRCRVDRLRARRAGPGRPRGQPRGSRSRPPPAAGRPPCRSGRPARSAAALAGDAGLLGEQRQQPGDGGGLAGAGSAGEHGGPLRGGRGASGRALLVVRRRRRRPASSAAASAASSTAGGAVGRAGAQQVVADLALLAPVAVEVEQAVLQRAAPPAVSSGLRRDRRRATPSASGQGSSGGDVGAPSAQVEADRPVADRAHGQRDGEQHLLVGSRRPARRPGAATCTSAAVQHPGVR